jgi:tetratricopeptide (TPR) repeat protein
VIEIDPRDRALHLTKRKRPLDAAIVVIVFLVFLIGGGYFYWQVSSAYSEIYKQLNIAPLPVTVELQPRFRDILNRLGREPCYRDAVVDLSDALLDSGYPRESATSLLAFAKRCDAAADEEILARAYIAFKKISDLPDALQVANRLIESDLADPQYRYYRAATYEQLKNFPSALNDYIAALQLMGAPYDIAGSQFYDVSRMYAALGRYCDAIAPIETFVSYNPAERRTPQTTQIISEYAQKGGCEAHYARGVGHVPFLNATGVRALEVVVNGVTGNFVLDSGAEFVSITPEFSARAKVSIETANQLPMKTPGGFSIADLGYADTISVGNAEAQGVAVAVIRSSDDPFGNHFDGLLGMSFLARFNLNMSQDGVELTALPLR